MKTRLLTHTFLLLSLLALFACKKKEESTTVKPYLDGINFDLPTFACPGDVISLKPYGVFAGDGKPLGEVIYKWKVNSDEFVEQESFTLTPEAIGNYTVTCQASDPDNNYYSCSRAKVVIVIDPALGKTLTGTGIDPEKDAFVPDERDRNGQNEYYFTTIGGLDWFRNNLAWTGAGLAYENADVTSYPLGRYYTWNEAKTACPEGWRLPTLEEWASLGDEAGPLLADAYLNSKRMWEYWPAVKRSNETRLGIIPAGYALPALTEPAFPSLYEYAAFWTATESEVDPCMAAFRYIHVEENDVRTTYGDKKSLALSVRCVR